jgi:hypothetical protein
LGHAHRTILVAIASMLVAVLGAAAGVHATGRILENGASAAAQPSEAAETTAVTETQTGPGWYGAVAEAEAAATRTLVRSLESAGRPGVRPACQHCRR